jgi:hypothetical protein
MLYDASKDNHKVLFDYCIPTFYPNLTSICLLPPLYSLYIRHMTMIANGHVDLKG